MHALFLFQALGSLETLDSKNDSQVRRHSDIHHGLQQTQEFCAQARVQGDIYSVLVLQDNAKQVSLFTLSLFAVL
jgi:hypothetical protein